jgi:thiamine transporter ThiT
MFKEKPEMNAVKYLDYLIRVTGAVALILGLAFWAGKLTGLVTLHEAFGAGVVLGVWALAILAFRKGVSVGLVAGAALCGVLTVVVGISQTQLLVGEFHWVVQAIHLLVGLGAIAMGAVLARALRSITAA